MISKEKIEEMTYGEIKLLDSYIYTGDEKTHIYISNKYQELSTTNMKEERSIVKLEFYGYTCELDIFWEELDNNNNFKLVIEMFVLKGEDTINNSNELLISDILKCDCSEDYLENTMIDFVIESME